MKYCEKCRKSFPDTQIYCSECGAQLSNVATPSGGTNTPSTPYGGGSSSSSSSSSSNSGTNGWIPVLLAGGGALVGWFFSGLFGFAMGAGAVGMIMQDKEQKKNTLAVALTWILAAVDAIFWLIAMSV